MNQSMNDEAVCRTAPATPGLLITDPDLGQCIQIFLITCFRVKFDLYSPDKKVSFSSKFKIPYGAYKLGHLCLINRPGVAGAVLQTASSLIH